MNENRNAERQRSSNGGRPSTHREVKDLAFAGYVHLKGVTLLKASKKGGDFTFLFDDVDGVIEGLKIEYTNSAEARFDAAIRRLKRLCHRSLSD